MTTNSRLAGFPLGAGLLVLGSPASPFALADDAAGSLMVRVDGHKVSVAAKDVARQAIVDELAAAAGLRVVQHAALDGTLSITAERESLPDALDSILGSHSYQLFQATAADPATGGLPAVPGTLWIFSEGAASAPVATVFLETVLYLGSHTEKKEAIRELGRLGTTEAVQSLSVALGDDDTRIRAMALEALSDIGSDDALAAIASLATDSDPLARNEAVTALSSGDEDSALAYLDRAMSDPDPRVRMGVIDSYADIPDDRAIVALSRALDDADPEVRLHALEALEEADAGIAFHTLMRAHEFNRTAPDAPR